MPPPIELSLSTLLPTITFLPPSLIALATSILSQSRAIAPHLKPEEEIARIYACAHIACTRLQKRLELEIARPSPPVKPSVYARLYGFLDGKLKTDGATKGARTNDELPKPRTPRTGTAIKGKKTVTDIKTPTNPLKRPRAPETEEKQPGPDLPDFAMPLVRYICRACAHPSAVPHILVGVTQVLREIASRQRPTSAHGGEPSSKKKRKTTGPPQSVVASSPAAPALATSRYLALLAALTLCTIAKQTGVQPSHAKLAPKREKIIMAIEAYSNDKRRSHPEGLTASLNSLDASIAFYLLEAEDCGWLGMEWYLNIPVSDTVVESAAADAEDQAREEDSDEGGPITPRKKEVAKTPLRRQEKRGRKARSEEDDEDVGPAGLLPGLGTMFQPAVDWLDEERRAGFAAWRREVLEGMV